PSASAIRIVTHTWLPGKKPNATPRLRVFTRSMPGSSLRSSPAGIECSTARLLSWSAATTAASTASARVSPPRNSVKRRFAASNSPTPADVALAPRARGRPGTERRSRTSPLAVNDPVDDDAVDDLQREDRQQGAEVDPAERGQHAAEDAQERFADVAQEPDHVIERARVWRADSDREEQPDDDVEKDEQGVDGEQRREIVSDLGARAREDHGLAPHPCLRRAGCARAARAAPRPGRTSLITFPARARRRARR